MAPRRVGGSSAGLRSALDERAYHRWLARHLPAGRTGLLPLGDDAAALRPPRGAVAVVTTDALVEGTHFLADSPPEWVGRAAAGVSLSDAAAKGASPAGVLLALLLPVRTPRGWAEAVARGAEAASSPFGASLVGGDTKPAPRRAVVSTVVAWGQPGHLAPRTGARAGDRLVTTGTVGRGGLAAYRLAHGLRPGGSRRGVLRALLDVRPRVREGGVLAGVAHAMLDTSDGLADGARLLSRASRLSAVIEEDRLPAEPGLSRLPGPARRRALVYGGDYELLAAVPPAAVPAARAAVRRAGGRLTEIGWLERGSGAWLESGGPARKRREMPPGGWRPFGRRRP